MINEIELEFEGLKYSDLPLFKWAKKGIVISKKSHRNWCDEYGLEQIVLSELL